MKVPEPQNEPIRTYAPGSGERSALEAALREAGAERVELPHVLAGEAVRGSGPRFDVVRPDVHGHVLATAAHVSDAEVSHAVDAAVTAGRAWREVPYAERAAVFQRAAVLLAGPWRDLLNAATMLGQSKSCYQADIDAACELADFWRFNAHFGAELAQLQPISTPGVTNWLDYRSLEGFVLAISPFNFTAIAGNLPSAPALMGNAVVWKPSPTQALAAHRTLELLSECGLPPGVINLVHGDGEAVSRVALVHRDLAGVHFTGSTATFQRIWATVGEHIASYRTYPRLVGETGGKDFVFAHPSADPAPLVTALLRGAFEYQGQKCSAASRAYIPRGLWESGVRDEFVAATEQVRYGDVCDFTNFGGAVIDRRAFDRLADVLARLADDPQIEILCGGGSSDEVGFFVEPTIVVSTDPTHEVFTREFFGPILSVYVYDEAAYDAVLHQAADIAPYALTGAFFAQDEAAIDAASRVLRFSAGNFYVNDKPTGAVVGQQPFGGGRASGTNDKSGSMLNLMRWTSARTIKRTAEPPTEWRHPHQG